MSATDRQNTFSGTREVAERLRFDVGRLETYLRGRVLDVSALGATVAEAQRRAYKAVSLVRWPEGYCRHDIGWRAVEREKDARSVR